MTKRKNFLTKKEILPMSVIIFSALIGLALYPQLPQEAPSHWSTKGVIDAWFGKNLAVIFFPLLILLIYLSTTFLFFFDPLKKNYLKFVDSYFWFRTILVIFLSLLYLFSLTEALRGEMNIIYFIIPAISIFIIYIGLFLPTVERNYFIGIRTPWTLHSTEVWNRTHKFSGKVFVIAGIISFFTILIPKYAFVIFTAIIISAALLPSIYSYYLFFKKEKRK